VFDLVRRVGLFVVPLAAITVILVGLLGSDPVAAGPEERAEAIARNVRCPFCEGESVAESTSSVATDYEVLIREWVDQGYSDDEIYDRFRARFGDGIVLDGGDWSPALWVIPVAAVAGGVIAILGLRRRRSEAMVEEPVP